MLEADLLYKIGVSLIPGIGSINAKKIIAHCGNAKDVFKSQKSKLLKIPGIGKAVVNNILNNNVLSVAEKEIEFMLKYNIKPLFYLDPEYPARLKHCDDSPVMLFIKGNIDFEKGKVISIVGTRNATAYGKEVCEKLVKELAEKNYEVLIISGLAYGIDVASHKAALKYGYNTVGVLAHGLCQIYPSAHKNIAKKMLEQGGLVTEFLHFETPERPNFVKRNRIIAGLADATIVIESGVKGGALITADIANSYNRDVFAFPGRAGDTWSEGCNKLIKTNKAALIENVDDLEYLMGWENEVHKINPVQKKLFVELSREEKIIYDLVKENNEITIDVLAITSKMPVSKVSPVLLNLEFSGLVKSLPGSRYKVI
ncbi:MAG: DNA-processing protein DprA [Bacteroidales bacterium]|nr:DNA-processing protein DprA [Bacteroidales bacterium]